MAERPTSQGFFLGEQLRRFRHAAGLSLATAAAQAGGISEAKLSRLEGGRSGLREADLVRLLDFYGVAGEQRDYLIGFCRQHEARPTGWWRERKGLQGGNVPQYLALEGVASRMRNVEPTLVPGLLQTPAYARVALRSRREGPTLDRETDARLARRSRILNGELDATFLVGETALVLVPAEVQFEQLRLLVELAARPNVTIRLIPYSEIAYLTHGNPLVLLGFADEGLPDVAYIEHWAGSFVIDDPADVDLCESRWGMIAKECLGRHDTIEWMRELWRG